MNYWTDDEWILSLGYYYFNKDTAVKKSNLKCFTEKLNKLTGNNRTIDSIELRVCNWRSLDPEFIGKGMANGGKKLTEYWQKYILEDTTHALLAQKYSDFINKSMTINVESRMASFSVPKCHVSSTIVYYRSPKVKELTLKRANGSCELCGVPAPFICFDGKPYLEVHHINSLSDGGLDTTQNTIALCPNCHRKVHYGDLTEQEKKLLRKFDHKTAY